MCLGWNEGCWLEKHWCSCVLTEQVGTGAAASPESHLMWQWLEWCAQGTASSKQKQTSAYVHEKTQHSKGIPREHQGHAVGQLCCPWGCALGWSNRVNVSFGENSVEFSLESSETERWREQRKRILQRVAENLCFLGVGKGLCCFTPKGNVFYSVRCFAQEECLSTCFILVFLLG